MARNRHSTTLCLLGFAEQIVMRRQVQDTCSHLGEHRVSLPDQHVPRFRCHPSHPRKTRRKRLAEEMALDPAGAVSSSAPQIEAGSLSLTRRRHPELVATRSRTPRARRRRTFGSWGRVVFESAGYRLPTRAVMPGCTCACFSLSCWVPHWGPHFS